eukprot:CAMPEP_0118704634 /NCGR_PEP_ID=MMETSP0800-20121206/19351_1 /TAXON_ID=210618 ORGANISM="Striatella unipunctata, Strain CCMP2910" /NCGR_SAMPLE_ID=MMETSP0800 /ASSEMBLY_ACC=CAM_ASM_000638 /LENGTH=94 /DNA_ID=CAMNT_0006606559 /DNA_START=126 /DNA_END=406 /DNA_ORIENTATION=-
MMNRIFCSKPTLLFLVLGLFLVDVLYLPNGWRNVYYKDPAFLPCDSVVFWKKATSQQAIIALPTNEVDDDCNNETSSVSSKTPTIAIPVSTSKT